MRKNVGSMGKAFHVGHGVRCGIFAALLASRGFTVDPDIIEGVEDGVEGHERFGMADTFNGFGNHDLDKIERGLGREWELAANTTIVRAAGFRLDPPDGQHLRQAALRRFCRRSVRPSSPVILQAITMSTGDMARSARRWIVPKVCARGSERRALQSIGSPCSMQDARAASSGTCVVSSEWPSEPIQFSINLRKTMSGCSPTACRGSS